MNTRKNGGLSFEGLDYHGLNTLGTLQKLWEKDREQGRGDPAIGMKLPHYMKSIGLKNIGARCHVKDRCIASFSGIVIAYGYK